VGHIKQQKQWTDKLTSVLCCLSHGKFKQSTEIPAQWFNAYALIYPLYSHNSFGYDSFGHNSFVHNSFGHNSFGGKMSETDSLF
jgi:hypothetical protein